MIQIDMKLPPKCADCPCAYWIQYGEFAGKLMCNVLEYKDQPKHHVVNYLVREYQPRRPDNCPMKEEK